VKRLYLLILIFLSTYALHAADSLKTVSLAYDVDFKMNFDNRELYKSAFSSSMTIFGARVTPSVGLAVRPQAGEEHKVMIGADVMKDFGGVQDRILEELTLYYRMQKDLGDTDLTLYAGIFPRSRTTGDYSPAFFSDSLLFYDNNLEGIMLQVKRPKASFEVACDWMGQYGPDRRERFMVLSAGEGELLPFMSLGYAAYLYHFASSYTRKGVVDNILLNPYVEFDFADEVGLQRMNVRLGWLQGMQNDRVHGDGYVFPSGGEVDLDVRNWNVGVRNRLFCGTDMMPLYNDKDNMGVKYGPELYMGDPFYRVYDDGKDGLGIYDRLEVYYEPDFKGSSKYINIRIGAIFHFNSLKYCGTQQMVTLRFNLQSLLAR
jgi:hypothetical protein